MKQEQQKREKQQIDASTNVAGEAGISKLGLGITILLGKGEVDQASDVMEYQVIGC